MAHYEVVENVFKNEAFQKGKPYLLLKDEVEVDGGCWAYCADQAFVLGKDGEDTVTIGPAEGFNNVPIAGLRQHRKETAECCGFKTDEYGNLIRGSYVDKSDET